jgi:hypothetical protein
MNIRTTGSSCSQETHRYERSNEDYCQRRHRRRRRNILNAPLGTDI